MSVEPSPVRMRPGVIIASICGVWLCYFVLASLRGVIVGFDFSWAYLSRRLAVTLASIAVTGALWPLLQLLDARPLWVRAGAILIGALPASLLLAAINQWAFADVEVTMVTQTQSKREVRIVDTDPGNVLVDPPPDPPDPPDVEDADEDADADTDAETSTRRDPAARSAAVAVPSATPSKPDKHTTIIISAKDPEAVPPSDRWAQLIDIASGRYFLLLAWAALYTALVYGEQARAAEQREGAYRRAAEASELRSLRYQVNPHFLFNTLNSLSALVMTGRLDDAERMIQTLSTFYRRTLSGDPTGDLPLAGEIELQQLYLDIEAVRFPKRLMRVIDLPDSLADAMVPGMILQPLVENSVKYAVAASRGAVTITIRAEHADLAHADVASGGAGRMRLTIADDGGGRSNQAARDGATPGCGIGLTNVRDRLEARFGGDATLTAGPGPDGGFRTVITMPLVRFA